MRLSSGFDASFVGGELFEGAENQMLGYDGDDEGDVPVRIR